MGNSLQGTDATFIHALANDGSEQILPCRIDPATGELQVSATFTGVLAVAITEADDSILIYGNDGPDASGTNRAVFTDSSGRVRTIVSDAAGTALTSTLVGADQALDVNVVQLSSIAIPNITDDSAFGVGVDSVSPIGGMFDDVAPDSVDEGDAGIVRMSANRNLYTQLRDAAGNERGVNVTAANQAEVAVTAALPAGTNNIGDVDVVSLPSIPAGANTIGSIASITTSVTPGTGAANLGKAEDAVHTTGDVGVMGLAVRNDALTALAGDGDYIPLMVDSAGSLAARVTASALPAGAATEATLSTLNGKVTVCNTGAVTISTALPAGAATIGSIASITTSVTPGTGAANLGKAEDAAHATGDVGVMPLAVRNDALTALAGTTGDYIPLMTDSQGSLVTRPRNTVTMAAPATATVSTASVVVLAANANRKYAAIVNDGGQPIYLAFGAPAVVGSGIRLNGNGGTYEITNANLTTQDIRAIRSSGSAPVTVQEGT